MVACVHSKDERSVTVACAAFSRKAAAALASLAADVALFVIPVPAHAVLEPVIEETPLPAIPGREAPRLKVVDANPNLIAVGVQEDFSTVQASVFNAGQNAAGGAMRASVAPVKGVGTGVVVETRPGRNETVVQTIIDATPGLRVRLATGRSWYRDHYLGQPARQGVTQEHWAVTLRSHWSDRAMAPDVRVAAFNASAQGNASYGQRDEMTPALAVDAGVQHGATLKLGFSPTQTMRIAMGISATATDFSNARSDRQLTYSLAMQRSLNQCTRLRTSFDTNGGHDSTVALSLQQPSWRMEARRYLQTDGSKSSSMHLYWQASISATRQDRALCREPLTILPAVGAAPVEALHRPAELPWGPAVRTTGG